MNNNEERSNLIWMLSGNRQQRTLAVKDYIRGKEASKNDSVIKHIKDQLDENQKFIRFVFDDIILITNKICSDGKISYQCVYYNTENHKVDEVNEMPEYNMQEKAVLSGIAYRNETTDYLSASVELLT